jgi:2,4-dienoyl-CoA reductase-like NADH-dependent reductase (Old Yellow Enzyme family)
MDLDRQGVRISVAGKIHDPADAERAHAAGADMVALGRAAILHHDYPSRLAANAAWKPVRPPVSRAYLIQEGLSEPFIRYMHNWPDFVSEEARSAP